MMLSQVGFHLRGPLAAARFQSVCGRPGMLAVPIRLGTSIGGVARTVASPLQQVPVRSRARRLAEH
jgi:hypothetical protein